MGFNETNPIIKTSSDGVWQGEPTLHYAFPLLIIQTTLVVFLSRLLAFLLKPLRQPKVIAEILAGIMLGPSAFGRNKTFTHWIFPSWSTPILECVSSVGLLFFLFLIGLELDLNTILKSGKKAAGIAFAGISLPFLFSIGVTFVLRKIIKGIDSVGYGEFFLFIGVSLSITAFPVLARILAELRLLTTQVGEMAMAAAAFNDVAAWILLALAVALAGGTTAHHSPLISLWVLLSGIGFVIFMFLIIRPIMIKVAQKYSSGGNNNNIVEELYICLTLVGVMLFGFTTDFIGIHAIFGAFIFGLVIPKNGDFSGRLISRIEDFVSGLLLPLYFASSGIKTDISQIHGVGAWGLVVLVVSTACAGKVLGTFIVGIMFCAIPMREALALGFLMNTKGLVELIVLNIGKEKKVLDDETFAILVIMALFTTFITTPIVMAINKKPSSKEDFQLEKPQKKTKKQNNLQILACLRGPRDAHTLINLIESLRSDKNNNNYASVIKLYVMRLVEFTDRLSSITMVQRTRKNGFPFISGVLRGDNSTDQVGAAFEAYSTLGRVIVRPAMAISGLSDLHEDIIHVAEKKRVELIILPFYKYWQIEGNEVEIHAGQGWKMVNERVMSRAPCSVAVVIDRGLQVNNGMRVCIVFFGGVDCCKALEIGSKMVEHPAIRVTLVRFIHPGSTHFDEAQRSLDDITISEFKMKCGKQILYAEKEANNYNLVTEVLAIGKCGEFELMIIGNKVKFPQGIMAKLFDEQHLNEKNNSEFGPMANLLASSGKGITSSVLVIQQQHASNDIGNSKVASFVDGSGNIDNNV
ncbi:Cation/H(+) antiporter 20 [Capsicum annuum]|uniref:Cation/H(+) antiporter 20 n=1 Tax=Capsicum annuum TaxID=4072 RepID=A0A1U8E5Q9_CAPAN|nr:Cation/H(+) antiporter 20 [Capsicum annuum]KAF3666477.1 Cation/H(+) antiporter 20 [Capsicum annuum]PHT72108.1 Cation/H(+) antiporter 20 [Capsicum annuum]